ncbi:MAG: S49 family peptidase [Chloroflexota bacterium]
MSRLGSVGKLLRRWFTSIPFFVLLSLVLGSFIAGWLIPKPVIATIAISGVISDETYVGQIVDNLRNARDDSTVRAVVVQIDSPGGGASVSEQIYLDLLRVRQVKPVVVSIGSMAASGGYYAAMGSNYIYAEPTSQIGSIGAWVRLPSPEEVGETIATTGPFKATGGTKRRTIEHLELLRQAFVEAVMSQRGERLRLSAEELSRAEIYLGIESLRYGLIDAIGTKSDALQKAASLAGLKSYGIRELYVTRPGSSFFFSTADVAALKSQASPVPMYYYLYFEAR